MKFNLKAFAVTLGALLLTLTPAMVEARTIYFLVGVRHIYRIGPDRDLFLDQREEIEKTYADGVAADEATYQQHVNDGADAAAEAQSRDGDLNLLAEDRDKSLGAIFDLRDDIRDRHPELRIDGDGPYQVMGIDYHYHGNVEVFDNFVVYAPWPGYVVVDHPYGGWVYGRPYEPGIFFNLYLGWHRDYVQIGAPTYYGGFYGHGGYVPFRAGVFIGGPRVYATYVQPGRTYFAAQVHVDGFNRFNRSGHGAVPGSFGRTNNGGPNRPDRGSSTSGWNRAGSGSHPGGINRSNNGGYSHGASATDRTGGQPRGSVGRPSTGGYSHGGAPNRTGSSGSFNRASGANRDNGARTGGFGNSSSGGYSRSANTGNRAGGFGNPSSTSGINRTSNPGNRGGYSHGGSSTGSSGHSGSNSGRSSSNHGSPSGGGHGQSGSDDKKGHGH